MNHFFTAFIAACCLALSAAAQEKAPTPKTITVTGTAEEEVTPDEIYVAVGLREYDKRGVGKIDIETIKTSFLTACKSIGLADSDITLQGFEGSDEYWQYRRGRKKNPDLKAEASYWVKLSTTQKLDELVDKLDDEATQSFSIARIDYSKRTDLKKQLKIAAIKAAKAKAEYLTDAIGEHIAGALTITEADDTSGGFYNLFDNARLANTSNVAQLSGDAAGPATGFKKMKFSFQVTVAFELK